MSSKCLGLFLVWALATTGTTQAAELRFKAKSSGTVQLVLEGEISPGDSKKFTQLVRNEPRDFMRSSSMRLNSSGGSIVEALKIADMIEKSGLIVTVDAGDTCASACFLLLVSAQFRSIDNDAVVLIHRPYLAKVRTDLDGYNSDLKAQQKVTTAMRNFLEERSISSSLVDMMMTYPSNDAHQLTVPEMFKNVGHLSPSLEELTISRCGLSNRNIFSRDRDFSGDPESDDLSCIRHFLISLKFDFTQSAIGEARFKEVFDTL